jgi:hypothetical protein
LTVLAGWQCPREPLAGAKLSHRAEFFQSVGDARPQRQAFAAGRVKEPLVAERRGQWRVSGAGAGAFASRGQQLRLTPRHAPWKTKK